MSWIQTFSGAMFWPLNPKTESIVIEDIAHALSMQCRYSGHCERFYSVAEHSVLLSHVVSKENALWALLHDASEAYLVDIPRPLKPHLEEYLRFEDALMRKVCERFGLSVDMPEEVRIADRRILSDELEQNMKSPPMEWSGMMPALGVTLVNWAPEDAERAFLKRFEELTLART